MRVSGPLAACVFAALLITSGCSLFKDKTFTPTEAEKKLIGFCLTEGEQTVITRRLGRTLWIYAPINEPIFDIKASDGEKPDRKIQPFSLLSLQAEFTEKYFKFNYDVVPDVLAPEAPSYGSSYNETYTKKRQLIYQAMQESFFNAKDAKNDLMPEFVVVMVADITKGIATQSIVYLKDLRRYMTEALPPDEYYMREVNDIIGQKTLIGDKQGRNAPYKEITWPYFLTEQIKGRIKYKFTTDLPDDTVPETLIARIAANTLRFYPFKNFTGVVLFDTRAKKELALTKETLKDYMEKAAWEEQEGKLSTIHFELPQNPEDGMVINTITATSEEKDPL